MGLQVARLIPGTETPAGDGNFGAQRCVLLLEDGTRRAAVIKRGPIGQISSEAFCSLLLKEWGLNVPDPFLIDEAGGVAFASADTGYPNLKQHLGMGSLPDGPLKAAAERVAIAIAMGFSSTPLATAADEAIDNRDRNLGNILWDGNTEAWIDHALALGEPLPDGRELVDANKLCQMATHIGAADRLRQAAVGQALALDTSKLKQASVALPMSLHTRDHADFVAARVSKLAMRLLDRFPKPTDLLSTLR